MIFDRFSAEAGYDLRNTLKDEKAPGNNSREHRVKKGMSDWCKVWVIDLAADRDCHKGRGRLGPFFY